MSMVDYKQLAMDCNTLSWAFEGAAVDNKLTVVADKMVAHERACRDAILNLVARAEAAEKRAASAEYRYGEEIGRRKAMEIRAERAETLAASGKGGPL